MRILGLTALLLITACAPVKSLEQLEAEATVTGDWSAVELRERVLARKAERGGGGQCPSSYVSFCQKFAGRERCECVSKQSMRQVFAGR